MKFRSLFLFRKLTALFLSASLMFCNSFGYAYSSPSTSSSSFSLPETLGHVEESHEGSNGKTILFIQDAHDSLEAQENIAKIITHAISRNGVKTVFEEGYEGTVPTDQYFGGIKNSVTKEKISYFLMDKLRIGGAEYAHINRGPHDFALIGADDMARHLETLEWYRYSARLRAETDHELEILQNAVRTLAVQVFPKELKEWMKLKDRLSKNEIPFDEYWKRMESLWRRPMGEAEFKKRYPHLSVLHSVNSQKSDSHLPLGKSDCHFSEKFFQELGRAERDYAALFLANERDRKLFEMNQDLDFLRRFNRISVTETEYEAVKEKISGGITQAIALFLFRETGQPFIFSKLWENHIKAAVRFYETAGSREAAVQKHLSEWIRSSKEKTAVLVFGGFHQRGIEAILKSEGVSYQRVIPKITAPSKRHEDYYQNLMASGAHPFEKPFLVSTAARALNSFQQALLPVSGRIELKAEIGAMEQIVDAHPSLERQMLSPVIERGLASFLNNPSFSARSEARNPEGQEGLSLDQKKVVLDFFAREYSLYLVQSRRSFFYDQTNQLLDGLTDIFSAQNQAARLTALEKVRQSVRDFSSRKFPPEGDLLGFYQTNHPGFDPQTPEGGQIVFWISDIEKVFRRYFEERFTAALLGVLGEIEKEMGQFEENEKSFGDREGFRSQSILKVIDITREVTETVYAMRFIQDIAYDREGHFDLMKSLQKIPDKLYFFSPGRADGDQSMARILGLKGAGLAEMARLNLPVPPGFTVPLGASWSAQKFIINKERFLIYRNGVKELEKRFSEITGGKKEFGNPDHPLFLSVRSGAEVSSPGEFSTFFPVGLHRSTLEGYARQIGSELLAYYDYIDYLWKYSAAVKWEVQNELQKIAHSTYFQDLLFFKRAEFFELFRDHEGHLETLKRVAKQMEDKFEELTGKPFPAPDEQLVQTIRAVVQRYQDSEVSSDAGLAVNIQVFVNGGIPDGRSLTGVVFSRNPLNGEPDPYGEVIFNAQGPELVTPFRDMEDEGPFKYRQWRWRPPKGFHEMVKRLPEQYQELKQYLVLLEKHYLGIRDVEFTVESGKLFLLQDRSNEKSASFLAKGRILMDMVREELIPEEMAWSRDDAISLFSAMREYLQDPVIRKEAVSKVIARGISLTPGIGTGPAVIWAQHFKAEGIVIDRIAMENSKGYGDFARIVEKGAGIITQDGSGTDHAAVNIRSLGLRIPYVTGVVPRMSLDKEEVHFGHTLVKQGEMITVDGNSGVIYKNLTPDDFELSEVSRVLKGELVPEKSVLYGYYVKAGEWIEKVRRAETRANAELIAELGKASGLLQLDLFQTLRKELEAAILLFRDGKITNAYQKVKNADLLLWGYIHKAAMQEPIEGLSEKEDPMQTRVKTQAEGAKVILQSVLELLEKTQEIQNLKLLEVTQEIHQEELAIRAEDPSDFDGYLGGLGHLEIFVEHGLLKNPNTRMILENVLWRLFSNETVRHGVVSFGLANLIQSAAGNNDSDPVGLSLVLLDLEIYARFRKTDPIVHQNLKMIADPELAKKRKLKVSLAVRQRAQELLRDETEWGNPPSQVEDQAKIQALVRPEARALQIKRRPLTHTVVTLDGASATGKGTVARELAKRLGFIHVDLGIFHRTLTEKALAKGIPLDSEAAIEEMIKTTKIELRREGQVTRVFRDGEEVTEKIRTPQVDSHVALLGKYLAVPQFVFQTAREMGEEHDIVIEGRNAGTDIFPDSPNKFFMTTSDEVRVQRRLADYKKRGSVVPPEKVREELLKRDQMDRDREIAPFRQAPDAMVVDNTSRPAVETAALIERVVRSRVRFEALSTQDGRQAIEAAALEALQASRALQSEDDLRPVSYVLDVIQAQVKAGLAELALEDLKEKLDAPTLTGPSRTYLIDVKKLLENAIQKVAPSRNEMRSKEEIRGLGYAAAVGEGKSSEILEKLEELETIRLTQTPPPYPKRDDAVWSLLGALVFLSQDLRTLKEVVHPFLEKHADLAEWILELSEKDFSDQSPVLAQAVFDVMTDPFPEKRINHPYSEDEEKVLTSILRILVGQFHPQYPNELDLFFDDLSLAVAYIQLNERMRAGDRIARLSLHSFLKGRNWDFESDLSDVISELRFVSRRAETRAAGAGSGFAGSWNLGALTEMAWQQVLLIADMTRRTFNQWMVKALSLLNSVFQWRLPLPQSPQTAPPERTLQNLSQFISRRGWGLDISPAQLSISARWERGEKISDSEIGRVWESLLAQKDHAFPKIQKEIRSMIDRIKLLNGEAWQRQVKTEMDGLIAIEEAHMSAAVEKWEKYEDEWRKSKSQSRISHDLIQSRKEYLRQIKQLKRLSPEEQRKFLDSTLKAKLRFFQTHYHEVREVLKHLPEVERRLAEIQKQKEASASSKSGKRQEKEIWEPGSPFERMQRRKTFEPYPIPYSGYRHPLNRRSELREAGIVSAEEKQVAEARQSLTDQLVIVDFREMVNPADAKQFSEDQIKEVVALPTALKGKVEVIIYNADNSSESCKILKALLDQIERANPSLKNEAPRPYGRGTSVSAESRHETLTLNNSVNYPAHFPSNPDDAGIPALEFPAARDKIQLSRKSLAQVIRTRIVNRPGQVIHLSKGGFDGTPEFAAAGIDGKILKFRYEDEKSGTLGFAATQADAISKQTADMLGRALPEGIGFNAAGKYFYVERTHAGIWSKIYDAFFVTVFARSA